MEYEIKLKFTNNNGFYFGVKFPLVYTDEEKKNLFFDSYDVLLDLKNNRIEDKYFSVLVDYVIWNITDEFVNITDIKEIWFSKYARYSDGNKFDYKLAIEFNNKDSLILIIGEEEKTPSYILLKKYQDYGGYYVWFDTIFWEEREKQKNK
jgi:hypothetical protein